MGERSEEEVARQRLKVRLCMCVYANLDSPRTMAAVPPPHGDKGSTCVVAGGGCMGG